MLAATKLSISYLPASYETTEKTEYQALTEDSCKECLLASSCLRLLASSCMSLRSTGQIS
jgi:hypothetical protein